MTRITRAAFAISAVYVLAAWTAFQWRNPTANRISFFRDFYEVATWGKLPEYQP